MMLIRDAHKTEASRYSKSGPAAHLSALSPSRVCRCTKPRVTVGLKVFKICTSASRRLAWRRPYVATKDNQMSP